MKKLFMFIFCKLLKKHRYINEMCENLYAEQCIDIVTIKNIKSIVTKEAFSSVEYRMETN